MSSRAYRLSSCFGCRVNYTYAFRCLFTTHSTQTVFGMITIATFVLGYLFRIIELPLRVLDVDDMKFNWSNSMWCAIISMTTVGYGDVTPRTSTGSILGLLCGFIGAQFTAFFVIAITQFLEFTRGEQFAYDMLDSIEKTEEIKQLAKNHIIKYYKLHARKRGVSISNISTK